MTDSNKSVSPLRQRMIDDMTMRRLNPKTQAGYLHSVKNFTQFFGRSPDRVGPEDLRRIQLQMVEKGVSSTTLNATITGLKLFYGVTLDRPSALKKMSPVRKEQKLPHVLSVEEVARLLQGASNLKHRSVTSPIRTRPSSTICCSRPQPRRCSPSLPIRSVSGHASASPPCCIPGARP